MKVLFITAYFPPCQFGWGYMRLCEQVADGLYERGHEIRILTSTYQDGEEIKPYPVHRELPLDPDWHSKTPAFLQFYFLHKQRESSSRRNLTKLLGAFQPDVIFIWHAHGLSREMLRTAESMQDLKTVYYFANYLPEMPDEYLVYWQGVPGSEVVRTLKTPLAKFALNSLSREGKPIKLSYKHSISVSQYVRDRLISQDLIGSDAVVIPNGVDLAVFNADGRVTGQNGNNLQVLLAGRVAPEKGIHTVLDSFRLLKAAGDLDGVKLTIIGSGPVDYRIALEEKVLQDELGNYVQFRAPVPITEMPGVYDQFDVLLLPSEWNEPLASVMLEAMAQSLVVIGTNTGGSGEVLVDGKTGLTFEPGNAASLARQLSRVRSDRDMVERLSQQGYLQVRENYDIRFTVSRIEKYLLGLIS